MEIVFANQLQTHIADLLWKTDSPEQVNHILKVYGKEAEVVYNMILAAYYDEDMNIDMSKPIIRAIMEK